MAKELLKEELKGIKEIANRIKNQDPEGKKWGTQPPLWFLLQDVEEIACNSSYNDPDFYYYNADFADEPFKGIDIDDLKLQMEEYAKQYDPDIKEDIEKLDLCYWGDDLIPYMYKYQTKRIFHTYEAAQNHLEANKHHYTDNARIYCDHAWRNPEAELIHKLLLTFAD